MHNILLVSLLSYIAAGLLTVVYKTDDFEELPLSIKILFMILITIGLPFMIITVMVASSGSKRD